MYPTLPSAPQAEDIRLHELLRIKNELVEMSGNRRQYSKKYGKVVSVLTSLAAGAGTISVAASAGGIAIPVVPVLAGGIGCGVV